MIINKQDIKKVAIIFIEKLQLYFIKSEKFSKEILDNWDLLVRFFPKDIFADITIRLFQLKKKKHSSKK